MGGQERARKALKARPKKACKIEGVPKARDFENLPGRVCPTIRGRLPWETHPCLFSIFVLMCCLVLPDFVSEYQGIPRGGSRNAQESKISHGNVKCLKGKPRERRGTPREGAKHVERNQSEGKRRQEEAKRGPGEAKGR